MSRRRSIAVALVLLSMLPVFALPASAAPVRVKVMTFNIFYGGDEWNLENGQW
jgi:hypothetical protein